MQDHLKERITGAAILVALVVLLVPEMFRGRPLDERGGERAQGDGPPVLTYNIDLRDTAAAQPPAIAANGAAAAAAPAMAPAPSPAAQPSAAPSRVQPAGEPASAATAAPPFAVPPAAAPSATAVPPATATPAVASAPRPAVAAPARQSGWAVQVGSFKRRDFAERMVRQVRAKGFVVEVAGPDDRGLYRVRSAPLAERAAALALRQKMLERGLKPIVNSAP